ncbi:hypothetical protein [Gordonia sp. VNK21]|uniref:competence protein CoiA family protein n=1 Tax=Gordonia sp. VNK21 TaxID=3382483 RepID=UPI0038D360F9
MKYAKQLPSNQLVKPGDVTSGDALVCPTCGADVFPRGGRSRTKHFAHKPGLGSPDCDEYVPGAATGRGVGVSVLPLQLVVLDNGQWELYEYEQLRSPQRTGASADSGVAARLAHNNTTRFTRWAGDGKNPATQPPERPRSARGQPSRTSPQRQSEIAPVFSRSRIHIFVRHNGSAYRAHDPARDSLVWGDELIILVGEKRQHLPLPGAKRLQVQKFGDTTLLAWRFQLPRGPEKTISRWLSDHSIRICSPQGVLRIVTPPFKYDSNGNWWYPARTPVTVATGTAHVQITARDETRVVARRRVEATPSIVVSASSHGEVTVTPDDAQTTLSYHTYRRKTGRPKVQEWTVQVGTDEYRPFSVGQFPPETPPEIVAPNTGVRFSLAAVSDEGETIQLLAASSSEANDWLKSNASRTQSIGISAGALGTVRLVSVPSAQSGDSSPNLAAATARDLVLTPESPTSDEAAKPEATSGSWADLPAASELAHPGALSGMSQTARPTNQQRRWPLAFAAARLDSDDQPMHWQIRTHVHTHNGRTRQR